MGSLVYVPFCHSRSIMVSFSSLCIVAHLLSLQLLQPTCFTFATDVLIHLINYYLLCVKCIFLVHCFRLAERKLAKQCIIRTTVATIISLLETLEDVSIEYDYNADTENANLLRAIRRLWDNTIFRQRLDSSTKCTETLKEVG